MFKNEAFLRTTPTTQDSKRLTFVYCVYIWLYLSLWCVLVFNTIWQLDLFKLGSWIKQTVDITRWIPLVYRLN